MFDKLFNGTAALDLTASMIEKNFPLPTISTEELRAMLRNGRPIGLFDIRTREEYDTSHLETAENIDPGMEAETFVQAYGDRMQNRTVVFYCSVGQRSSEFLQRVLDPCRTTGTRECYNLRGGIFRWYNNGFPVFDKEGETHEIHGYNLLWSMMVERRDK